MIFYWTNKMEGLATARSMLDLMKQPGSLFNNLLNHIDDKIVEGIRHGHRIIVIDVEHATWATEISKMHESTNRWYVNSIQESFKKKGHTLTFEFDENKNNTDWGRFRRNKWIKISVITSECSQRQMKYAVTTEEQIKSVKTDPDSLLNKLLKEIDEKIRGNTYAGNMCREIRLGVIENIPSIDFSENMKELEILESKTREWYITAVEESLQDRGFLVSFCYCSLHNKREFLCIQLKMP